MTDAIGNPAYSHWKSRFLIRIGRTLNSVLRWPFFMLSERSRAIAVSHILGELSLCYTNLLPGGQKLEFFAPSFKPLHRGQTVLTLQPEVPRWIDRFKPSSVFWDIGANVGAYTVYAGLREDINVLAFEPAGSNYYVLNKNIELNKQTNRVSAYCLALSDSSSMGHLTMLESSVGSAHHAFGDPRDSWDHLAINVVTQGAMSVSIDDLVYRYKMTFPNYIKIDVDGIEDKILAGSERTLKDIRLRSVLLEMQSYKPDANKFMFGLLGSSGFSKVEDFGLNYIFSRP